MFVFQNQKEVQPAISSQESKAKSAFDMLSGACEANWVSAEDRKKLISGKGGYIKKIKLNSELSLPMVFKDETLYIKPSYFDECSKKTLGYFQIEFAFFSSPTEANHKKYEKAKKEYHKLQDDFAITAINAVMDGLNMKKKNVPAYKNTDISPDIKFLAYLRDKIIVINNRTFAQIEGQTDEKIIPIRGKTFSTEEMHNIFQNMAVARGAEKISEEAFMAGYYAYIKGLQDNKIKKGKFIIVDFNEHISKQRLFLMDFSDENNPKLLASAQVEHGIGSDPKKKGWISRVSSREGSLMSSEGLYSLGTAARAGKYQGIYWQINGIYTTNFNALERTIWIHLARGMDLYSEGCFGIPLKQAEKMGIPLAGKNAQNISEWTGVGLYAFYDFNVQNDYKREWNERLKQKKGK